MKRIVFAAALMYASCASADPYVIPAAAKDCRIWSVPLPDAVAGVFKRTPDPSGAFFQLAYDTYLGGATQVGSFVALVDNDSMQLMALKFQSRVLNQAWRADRANMNVDREAFIEIEARQALADYLTTGSGNVQCAARGTQSGVVGDQVRAYLESEVQRTVKATVTDQMTTFLEQLKQLDDARRQEVIQKALDELPKNADLVSALREALKKP